MTLAPLPAGYGLRYAAKTFGFSVRERQGTVVVDRVADNGPAAKIGVRHNDLIAEVEGEKVGSVKGYDTIMEARLGQTPLRFLILRGRRGYYVDLP